MPASFDLPDAKSSAQAIKSWIQDKYQYRKYYKAADPEDVTPCPTPLQMMSRAERSDFYEGKMPVASGGGGGGHVRFQDAQHTVA